MTAAREERNAMRERRGQVDAAPLAQAGRFLVWAVILTASIKPAEILSIGEQSVAATPVSDLLFRALVLLACVAALGIALSLRKLRQSAFIFCPFLLWTFVVAVATQAAFSSAKQIGSYATWIFLFMAASALLDRPGDYRKLTFVMVFAIVLSALGALVQHALGYGPGLGSRWSDESGMEFMRTHTGSGGILLDTFAPYSTAILLLSGAGARRAWHVAAWLFVLWGAANILRGGILAIAIGLCWFLWRASRATRRRVLPLMGASLLVGGLLFGSVMADKLSGSDEVVNTSGRFDVWPQLAAWISEAPLLGHGPDADMELLETSAAGRDLRAAHNELLSTGVNFGIIGILLLWGPLLLLLLQSAGRANSDVTETREPLLGATAVLIMIVSLSLTDNTLRSPGIMILALAPTAVFYQRSSPDRMSNATALFRRQRLLSSGRTGAERPSAAAMNKVVTSLGRPAVPI